MELLKNKQNNYFIKQNIENNFNEIQKVEIQKLDL